jgi:hypothetical protein
MQKPLQKALLRKFLIAQCRKKHRQPLPVQVLSLTMALPPTLQPQPRQSELPHSQQHTALGHEQSRASRTCL